MARGRRHVLARLLIGFMILAQLSAASAITAGAATLPVSTPAPQPAAHPAVAAGATATATNTPSPGSLAPAATGTGTAASTNISASATGSATNVATETAPAGAINPQPGVHPAGATSTATVAPQPGPPTPRAATTPSGTGTGTQTPTGAPRPSVPAPGTTTPSTTATATGKATPAPAHAAAAMACTPEPAGPWPTDKAEVVSARTRTSRTYRANNGLQQTIFSPGSVNYPDAQGKLQPIDGTLVTSATGGYAYQNRANGYTLLLPGDLSANPVKVQAGNVGVSFSLVGAAGAESVCHETATYANALPGVIVAYAADNDVVKETLTLTDKNAPHVFVYHIQTSGGLTARTTATNGVAFVDGGGTVQLAFAPPFMDDATGKLAGHSTALTALLTPVAGGVTLTYTADLAWLTDPARQYPVTIDPSVIPHTTNTSLACLIDSGAPVADYCPYATLYVGSYNGHTYRSLLNFPGVAGTLPTGGIVQNAELGVFVGGGSGGSIIVDAHGLSHRFTSGLTWNTYDGTNAWTAAGGDYATAVASSANLSNTVTGYAKWYPSQLVAG